MKSGAIRLKADCPRRDQHDSEPCKVILKGKPLRTGVRLPNGKKECVIVQQLECSRHGKFRVCPDFLLSHKHYVAEIIDEALAAPVSKESVDSFCARWGILDTASPTRWIRSFGNRLVKIAQYAERRLPGLCPSWRATGPPIPETPWTYAYVWTLLGRLKQACQEAGVGNPCRAHFAFLV